MGYHAKIVNRVADIDAVKWDQLHAGIPFGSLTWVRLAMDINPDFEPYFILVYDGDKLVGRATAAFSKHHGMSIASPVKRAVIDGLLERFPLLQCQGMPYNLASISGLVLPKGNEVEAMRVITKSLYEIAHTRSTSFIAMGWVSEAEHRAIAELRQYHTQIHNETVLVNRWANFDEYIQTLGKTARKDFRQHTNHAHKMGIRVEETGKFAQYADQFQRLMTNVDDHYQNMGRNILAHRFFEIAEKDLAQNGQMLLAWVDDELVGFGYLLHDCGVLKPTLLGKDYRFKYVYFEIFYAMLRFTIDNGFRLVRGGVGGAYQFKRSLGFENRSTYTAYTTPSPVFQWIGAKLAHGVNAETQPELAQV